MKLHQKRLLDQGKIEKLVASLRSLASTNAEVLEKIRTESDYFERSAARMRYSAFRRQHLFVGSGVMEAGCKTVIGSQTLRYVPDRSRSQRYHRPAMLPPQWPLRGLLGDAAQLDQLPCRTPLYTFLQVAGMMIFEKRPLFEVFHNPAVQSSDGQTPNQLNLFKI